MKALKTLLVLGLLCSANGYVVKAESEDVKQDTVPVEGQSQDVEVATGTDTETTDSVINVDSNVAYSTLSEAVKNAKNNDTLKLNKNVDISDVGLVVDKSITLDLNGKEILAANTKKGQIKIEGKGKLILEDNIGNGRLYTNTDYIDKDTGYGIIGVKGPEAEFVMNGGHIDVVRPDASNKGEFGVTIVEGGKVEINGGKIEAGWFAIAGNGTDKESDNTIIINGGELISEADYAIYHPHAGDLIVNDGVIYGATGGIAMNRGNLYVHGGTITSKGKGDTGNWGDGTGGLKNAALTIQAKYGLVNAEITGGEFVSEGDAVSIISNSSNESNLVVKGGVFSSDISELLPEGTDCVKNEDGKFEVVPSTDSVVSIGSKGYLKIEDALQEVNDGETIKLLKDWTESITVSETKNITLDLGTYTLTNEAGKHTITNNGTLTITGEGTVDNVSNGKAAVFNDVEGKITLDGGQYTRSKETGKDEDISGGNSFYNLQNHGSMTINEGVVVKQEGAFSSLVANGWFKGNQNTSKKDSVLIVNGGHFEGGLNTIKNDDFGKLTINDGTFTNVAQSALLNWNVAEINGGTFESKESTILNGKLDDSMDKGELVINGGSFTSGKEFETIDKINGGNEDSLEYIDISGGSFSSDVSKYVADDASYVKVDDVYYAGTEENVQEKVEDAKESVEVIKGVTELTNVPEGVKLENKTGQDITVNGDTVANGSEVTVKPETKPDYRPSGGSSVSASNVSAVTADGDKVKAKEVGTASELKDKLADKKAVVASIEVGKADGEVTVTYKAGKEVQAKTLYVVNLREDGQLMLLDTVKADAKGNVVVKVKPGTTFTLLTKLNGWILDLEGNWYFYEEDGTPADRWLANAVTWFMIEDGKMLTNEWVASSEGRWYYVGNDGSIVYNQWVDGCWINEEGIYYSPTYNK